MPRAPRSRFRPLRPPGSCPAPRPACGGSRARGFCLSRPNARRSSPCPPPGPRASDPPRPGFAVKHQSPEQVLDTAPVVDASHDLLSQVAALRVAHRLVDPGLLRKVRGTVVLPEARDPGLDTQHFQRLLPDPPRSGRRQRLKKPFRIGLWNPERPGRRTGELAPLDQHLGAADRNPRMAPTRVQPGESPRISAVRGPTAASSRTPSSGRISTRSAMTYLRRWAARASSCPAPTSSHRRSSCAARITSERIRTLRRREESIGARARREPLHVAGHIGMKETEPVGADQL